MLYWQPWRHISHDLVGSLPWGRNCSIIENEKAELQSFWGKIGIKPKPLLQQILKLKKHLISVKLPWRHGCHGNLTLRLQKVDIRNFLNKFWEKSQSSITIVGTLFKLQNFKINAGNLYSLNKVNRQNGFASLLLCLICLFVLKATWMSNMEMYHCIRSLDNLDS